MMLTTIRTTFSETSAPQIRRLKPCGRCVQYVGADALEAGALGAGPDTRMMSLCRLIKVSVARVSTGVNTY